MIKKNKCSCLILGKKYYCKRKCIGEYCAHHNYQLQIGIKNPFPCILCKKFILIIKCVGNVEIIGLDIK